MTTETQAADDQYDVVILGAGLAGLTLSRQLLLESGKRILVLDKSPVIPTARQKYGESTVQVGGYYLGKVLDLEQYLWHEHLMKYNLRFYFKTPGRENVRFEDYGQTYICNFSNIPCYQLDRNRLEKDLVRMNQSSSRFKLVAPATAIQVDVSQDDVHRVVYRDGEQLVSVKAEWVVDTTGRGRLLARQLDIRDETPIQHGASFMWVEGTVDIEKLTDRSLREIRLDPARRSTGHLPHWLATNHFMGEGFWFWVIPLRDKTSLGLVFDKRIVDGRRLATAEALRDWVCKQFPLFADDLSMRKVVDFNTLKSYAHGCQQTISAAKWAMSGESGRFTDPLYSPGSDFVALHNTLIVDAILCEDRRKLKRKCWLAETMMQSWYSSLMPSFVTTYDALGDQETFVLKYTWELSIYFSFFVFPFINDLATDGEFIPALLSRFSRIGVMNQNVQKMISGYYQWKKAQGFVGDDPLMHDFTDLQPLQTAAQTFYRVGLSSDEAKQVLDEQLLNLKQLARFIVAHIYALVLGDEQVLISRSLVESIDFKELSFDVERMQRDWDAHRGDPRDINWSFDPGVLRKFQATHPRCALAAEEAVC